MRRRTFLLGAAGLGAAALTGVPSCTSSGPTGPPELVLATGPQGAVFREIGAALAAAVADHLPGTRVRTLDSNASVDNLNLLLSGKAQLGFSALDAALSMPSDSVRAIGRIYDSFLQLVVRTESTVRYMADLDGLTVSVGASGSGTEFTTIRLLNYLNIHPKVINANQADSSVALTKKTIDAFFTATGIPTPAITGLIGPGPAPPPIKLVPPLTDDHLTLFLKDFNGPYEAATIPATTYRDIEPCGTIAIPNLLLARADLADDVVEVITRTVFTESSRIASGHPEASRINVRTGISTGPIPLHPGAAAWFRSAKR